VVVGWPSVLAQSTPVGHGLKLLQTNNTTTYSWCLVTTMCKQAGWDGWSCMGPVQAAVSAGKGGAAGKRGDAAYSMPPLSDQHCSTHLELLVQNANQLVVHLRVIQCVAPAAVNAQSL
jgi:hypothetical protein